jgi:SAM-dependent methyltransferase
MLERNFGAFGLADALSAAQTSVDVSSQILREYATSKIPRAVAPLCFDSQNLAVIAYKGAMERVSERFWTTTFLGSGFWCDAQGDILDANIRMMNNCRRAGAVMRRLFLLTLPPEEEIQRIQDQRILLLKCEDFDGLARFDERMANLARNITLLSHHGCDVRVVHDAKGRHRELPADLNSDPRDTELAIYDDWRFDLFRGGMFGTIQSVQCYTPAMPCFSAYRDTLARYFEELWAQSAPIEAFLDRLRKNVEYSSSRIDYPVSWLVHYDHALPREDEALKIEELCSVRVELVRLGHWGFVRRFLDVGTCTGRYLVSLRDAVATNGMILGVDNDIDCVRFTQAKVRREFSCESRLRIERHDFRTPEPPSTQTFDLVTCMLGTVLHFERQETRGPPYHDDFQRALEKFARLLTEDGVFFFSVWTEEACRTLRLLSIYSNEDKCRLARAAISQDELRQRLECAGLRTPAPILLQERLLLYRCERGPANASSRTLTSREYPA